MNLPTPKIHASHCSRSAALSRTIPSARLLLQMLSCVALTSGRRSGSGVCAILILWVLMAALSMRGCTLTIHNPITHGAMVQPCACLHAVGHSILKPRRSVLQWLRLLPPTIMWRVLSVLRLWLVPFIVCVTVIPLRMSFTMCLSRRMVRSHPSLHPVSLMRPVSAVFLSRFILWARLQASRMPSVGLWSMVGILTPLLPLSALLPRLCGVSLLKSTRRLSLCFQQKCIACRSISKKNLAMKTSKDPLLKSCRYYKGETESPFSDSRSALWSAERNWVQLAQSASPLLDEYLEGLRVDLPELANNDHIHQSLKAFLFDRYCHFGGTPSGFPVWLSRNYPK